MGKKNFLKLLELQEEIDWRKKMNGDILGCIGMVDPVINEVFRLN